MSMLEDFHDLRRVGTPWVGICTTDYLRAIPNILEFLANADEVDLSKKNPEPQLIKAACWDCVSGAKTPILNSEGEPISEALVTQLGGENNDSDPLTILRNAQSMDENAVLFFVVPTLQLFDNGYIIQAISNLREVFKGRGCILAMIGPEMRLPILIAEDVPVLYDPLPADEELSGIVGAVIDSQNKALERAELPVIELELEEIERAAGLCLGMTRFAVEEGVARKLHDTGIDFAGLTEMRRNVIETSSKKALKFETQPWTGRDMGGADAWWDYIGRIFKGPRRPQLIVRVDEIDKSVTAASTGTVADNTGVSQDLLRAFLLTLEDNDHMGVLFNGPPGTGKTLASIATGNEFGCSVLAYDMGAVKGSLVGESEQNQRRVMQTILAMGDKNVLWIATCNRVDTLPPELQARFWLGTWFWDLPTEAEKKLIWGIQRKRYGIDEKDQQPDDQMWVGRDVRNCCRLAKYGKMSLKDASKFITVTGVVNAVEIERSRDTAQKRGYLSAAIAGAYKRPESRPTARQIRN